MKPTDTIGLTYSLQTEVNYDIPLESLVDNFGYELGVDTVEQLLRKYPTSEKLAEAIEVNLSVQSIADYECYSDIMEEVLIRHEIIEGE